MDHLIGPVSHSKVAEVGFELRPSDSEEFLLLLTTVFYCSYSWKGSRGPQEEFHLVVIEHLLCAKHCAGVCYKALQLQGLQRGQGI